MRMILRVLCLGLACLLLVLHETLAYQPGSYYDASGLSAATRETSDSSSQPIYERDSACPAQFRGLKPYAHDCHRFVNCAEGRPVIQTCAPGTAFNALTHTCDQQSKATCESPAQAPRSARIQQLDASPKCAPGFSGLQPHPYDCNKFLNCANGQTFIQVCGPGTAFDAALLTCDYKHKVNCAGDRLNSGGVAANDRLVEVDVSRASSVGLTCPAGVRGPYPHPTDPYKYLICGIGVQPRLEQCQLGEIFDGHRLVCVSSRVSGHFSSARLKDLLCPDGVEGLFAHPFDQTKFLNCKAGKVAVQSCIHSNVFSLSKGYCQPKAQLAYSDYVAYIVSEISYEYSLILTGCPAGTDGLHIYPYDAGKYVRCGPGGELSILSCDEGFAYSFTQRACRPLAQVNRGDRVKFSSELVSQSSYSYTDSQAFQSALSSCPRSLRGNYAYPFHGGYFVLCQNGLLQVESCPSGTVYSLSKRRCLARQQLSSHEYLDYGYISVEVSNKFMQDLTTVTCPANAQGYYLHPFDCTKFLLCRDQQTSIQSCEQGKVFSISQRSCVARDQLDAAYDRVEYLTETQHEFYQGNQVAEGRQLQNYPRTVKGEVSCPAGASGVHPHPYDCTKFLNCANGQTFIQDCGPGTAFSASLLVCDFKEKVDCGQSRSPSYSAGTTTSYGSSLGQESISFNGPSCPHGTRGLYPHPSDSHMYLVCGIGVQPRVEHCQSGEIFDSHRLACVSNGIPSQQGHSASAKLTDLLCPLGVEGLFAHPFDQTKFLNCKAGKVVVQSCIPSNVFSLSKGYCQPKAQLAYSDYVAYIVSEISYEYSLILTGCPAGTDGLHIYPYDAGKYVRCGPGGELSILSCDEGFAYSFTQRACRPLAQVNRGDRVKFSSELVSQSSYSYTDSQAFQSALSSCPRSLRGNYAYPFHGGYFVLCQNGLLQVESCPSGTVYSLSKRRCLARQQLSSHEYLDYGYISVEVSNKFMQDLTTVTCPANAQGYYLHPFDCTKFLLCRDQQTSIQSCEQGKVFSISQRSCVARDQLDAAYDRVEYLTETQHEFYQGNEVPEGRHLESSTHTNYNGVSSYRLICPGHVYGLYAHPFDARSYLYCADGNTEVKQCMPSEFFSVSRGYCLSAEGVTESDRVSMISHNQEISLEFVSCPRGAVGYFVYPFDCTQYLTCDAGMTRLQSCPSGQHFSLTKRSCQSQEQVQRSERVYSTSELQIFYEWWQQLQRMGAVISILCPFGLTGNYQHPTLPHKFISCPAPHSQALLFECPSGQVFSASQRVCVPPVSHNREEATGSYGWIDLRHDHREPKAHDPHAGYDQYASGSAIRTTTVNAGDRWSNMNMHRPAGIGFNHDGNTQQALPSGWSGQGSSYNQRAPSQSVLYVEGSLQPNRKYPPQSATSTIYKAPLAPMAPTTTSNVYYAQPVEEPTSWSRQNFSRKINDNSHTNDWQPAARQPHRHQPSSPLAPLEGQRPLDLDFSSDDQLPGASRQQPGYRPPDAPVPGYPGATYRTQSQPQPHSYSHSRADESNLFGGLQPPTPPPQPQGYSPDHLPQPNGHALPLPGQRPLNLDYEPDADPQRTVDQPDSRQRPSQLPSNPPRHPSYRPPVPANHSPTYRDQNPSLDESNLYGGLQPPTPPTPYQTTTVPSPITTPSNLRTYPIYPQVANATRNQLPNHPHYSPPYSGVAHSHNATWQKVPTRSADPFNVEEEYDEDEFDEGQAVLSLTTTTTEKSGLRPPPFNHQFYNPTQSFDPHSNPTSKVALNEALRLMLRPYFNHSGNAPEELAEKAENAIASVISKPPTDTKPRSTTPMTTTPRNPTQSRKTPDDDVELIVAGEQESLDDTDDDSVVPDAGETARTEQTLNPTTYSSGHDSTDFQRGTRRVDVDSSTDSNPNQNSNSNPNNWHTRGHSREFHLRHPNMPDPFEKPQHPEAYNPHQHQHHHHHHNQYHQHEHSRLYHSLHPNLPNPFPRQEEEEPKQEVEPQQEEEPEQEPEPEFLPNPNAEATTPHTPHTPHSPQITVRGAFDEDCEFDCGGGKCIKRLEVCDGVNNCGNRQDERQCDHLGYALRLTGGESPHMGRVEVKVNGQWGYVCDDKFGLRDADVVCRELGFKNGAAEVRGNSYYEPPERNFNYAMDELECRGNETQLKDCDFKGWGVHNCGVDEVVGVVCKVPVLKCPNNLWLCHANQECIPPTFVCDNTPDCTDKSDECDAVCKAPIEYRLEGGRSSNEGRLEVKYHGVWGSVCDDDFNLKSAQVACNALGYYGQPKIEKNIFGPGSGPIWLDQVLCFGNETSIDKCSHWNWGEHNCNHTEDVGLRCTAGPPPRQQRLLQRTRLQAMNKDKSGGSGAQSGGSVSLSDIGLWERSSKAIRTPRRCGIFKDDLFDEFAHPEQRVVQGSVARRGRHPWQATIRTRGRGGISSHWCGAVVISKRHLLTAAHCLYGHPKGAYFVRVGDHYANIAENSEVDSFIDNWYVHEKFREPTHMNNDIAVVVLKTPLKFSDYVQPICLPERGAPLLENRTCTISGWGSIKSGVSTPSQELRAAQLPILPDTTCKQMNVYGDAMTEGMFCAGSMDESVDACEGDSGGPLVCSDEDGETLYGIISWGQHCGYQNRPGVYVRVCHYIDWIYEKINQSLLRF